MMFSEPNITNVLNLNNSDTAFVFVFILFAHLP